VSSITSSRYGSVLVVGAMRAAGAQLPLYEFSGDVGHHFGCATNKIVAYDSRKRERAPHLYWTEGDLLADVSSDDWPAFTTKGSPVAGHGVDAKLLERFFAPASASRSPTPVIRCTCLTLVTTVRSPR